MRFSITSPVLGMRFSRPGAKEPVPRMAFKTDVILRAGKSSEQARVETERTIVTKNDEDWVDVSWEGGAVKRVDLSDSPEVFRADLARFSNGDPGAINTRSVFRLLTLRPPPQMTRVRLDASALRRDSQLTTSRHGRFLGTTGEGLPLAIERLGKSKEHARIVAGLQDVYPRIENVGTVHLLPGQVALSFKEIGIQEALGQANVSDGVMHALALLVTLETVGPLAIEEPENALHPWALRKIIERSQGRLDGGILLVTTHSPTVVDAIADPAALFIVENTVRDGTTVVSAEKREEALRSILSESGQRLGDVWLSGALGGVPGE
jgi:hypothetical protein